MLYRLLFFVVLICLVLFIFLSRRKRSTRLRSRKLPESEQMVLDPQCQSYLPKRAALSRGGHYFCSEECARLYLSR